uniref:C3H1-type domain-containing protein n=1 Tax=Salix viminalis TaxID=40686 RepID=A0A6N2L1V2_SALVM
MTDQDSPIPPEQQTQPSSNQDDIATTTGEKRKRENTTTTTEADPSHSPFYKTSLCSYFRRTMGASCSHGSACKYAHGEEELRPRPDNTWDPTSERAKKAIKLDTTNNNDSKEEDEEIMMTDIAADGDGDGDCLDAGLSKCLVHLPRKWQSDHLRKFLSDQGILFKSAKKKKGMSVGFVSFEDAEQLKKAIEEDLLETRI